MIIINTEVVNITVNLIVKNYSSVFFCVRISRKKKQPRKVKVKSPGSSYFIYTFNVMLQQRCTHGPV